MRHRSLIVLLTLCMGNILYAQKPKLVLPIGHTGSVIHANFSPDGKRMATATQEVPASEDGAVKIWDVTTGALLLDLRDEKEIMHDACFSPDNKSIVTVTGYGQPKIWNVYTGQLLFTLLGHTGYIYSAEFSPDGKYIVTCSGDSTARIWEAATGRLFRNLKGHQGAVESACFSSDGKMIVTASMDGTVRVWNSLTGKLITRINAMLGTAFTASFSPDNKRILTPSSDNAARIWDALTGKPLLQLGGSAGTGVVQYSPDGKKVVGSYGNGRALVWNAITGTLLAELPIDTNSVVRSVWFSPDNMKILTAPFFGEIKIWDAQTYALLININMGERVVHAAQFSPDGKKIVTASGYHSAQLWDVSTANLLADTEGHTERIYPAKYSPDGKKIIAFTESGRPRVWDTDKTVLLQDLTGSFSGALFRDYSPDHKKAIISDSSLTVWDTEKNLLLAGLTGSDGYCYSAYFSPDHKKIIAAFGDSSARIWDTETGILEQVLKKDGHSVRSAHFSYDGKKVITASKENTGMVWDVEKNQLLTVLGNEKSYYYLNSARFSPDDKKIVTASEDYIAKIWDAETGKILFRLSGHQGSVYTASFSPDGKKVVTASEDNTACIWDAGTGIKLLDLKGHSYAVKSAEFSPDGKRVLTASLDNTLRVWDSETGQLISTFFSLDRRDHFTLIPGGFYQCTPASARLLHYVTKDLQIITFDQLDVKNNRPDKVLSAIGCTDTSLVASYRKAYHKRIKKLGIDTASFSEGFTIPEADFANRNNIPAEQNSRLLTLPITGNSTAILDRLNIWVNEVPLYGQKGISLRQGSRSRIDTTIGIVLSEGMNRIETSVRDINGIESYRQPLFIKYNPERRQPSRIFFIGIGINHFADSTHNLSWSVKDIRDLSGKFAEKGAIIDTLFDWHVTKENIMALKNRLAVTGEEDKVVIAYSGHGLLNKEYDYYLSTYAVDFKHPEKQGLLYDELESMVDGIKARKKLLLIDACHSGEVDKEEMLQYTIAKDSLDKKGVKGLILESKEGNSLGMKNSFELMQELFLNVGRSTGATVISAAAGTQFALESGDLKNGVFTYCILNTMNNSSPLTISAIKKAVTERVPQLTRGLQKPTFRSETQQYDWEIW